MLKDCCTRQWHGNLKKKMYVYLIETKTVHSSTFPARFYLTLVLFTILIRSTTWIWWRPGIYADSKHVFVFTGLSFPVLQKAGWGLGTRQRIHLGAQVSEIWCFIKTRTLLRGRAWWGWSVASWSVSSLWSSFADSIRECDRGAQVQLESIKKPLIFHPYNQLHYSVCNMMYTASLISNSYGHIMVTVCWNCAGYVFSEDL